MSRIGRKPIILPKQVTLKVEDKLVIVTGPKGELKQALPRSLKLDQVNGQVTLKPASDTRPVKALHGLYRSLLNNMIIGVSQGFQKRLQLVGAGYRAKLESQKLILSVGFSHQVTIEQPPGITFALEGNNQIIITGIDKQQVGQVAAAIRQVRPPEPYKGKGIRYQNELVRRKAGKAAKVGAAAAGGAA